MNSWTIRAALPLLVLGCLAGVRAQTRIQLDGSQDGLEGVGKSIRQAFEQKYPPDRTYAVALRGDLPTLALHGREPGYPVEIVDTEWKGPGSMFRGKPVGNLAVGDVLKVEEADYSNDRVDLRLVSVDEREIVVDPSKPERNRRDRVVTRLRVPHDAGLARLVERLDGYVRLFPGLEAARDYAAHLHEPQPDRRFTLGILRRDGILIPIASYDHGHWFRRWPVPAAERDVPMTTGQVPAEWWGVEGAASTWTLWTPDGASRPLHVAGPLAFGAHCLMNVGLRTDYRAMGPPPPLDQHHYPKEGVTTTGSLPIERVEVLTSEAPTWRTFEQLIAPHVSRLEAPLVFRMPLASVSERSTTPVKLEVLCFANGSSANSYTAYFEASRRYPPADKTVPDPCGVVSFAQGWAHRAPSGTGTLDREARVQMTDCSMWDVEFKKPLGVIRVDGAVVWIMEVSRWGGERYELVQTTESKVTVLLSVPGGWCKSIGD